jgi:hypothetical protein
MCPQADRLPDVSRIHDGVLHAEAGSTLEPSHLGSTICFSYAFRGGSHSVS